MKKITVLIILFCLNLTAQSHEFNVYTNGLIYSENSVTKLKQIVDSLNLKFKTCEPNKTFLSSAQTKANFIRLNEENAVKAKKDIENNISYTEFKAKYPEGCYENLLVTKSSYTDDYRNIEKIVFSSLEMGAIKRNTITKTQKEIESYGTNLEGKWVYEFYEKTKYSKESLEAFYIIDEFESKPLAIKYARLIQYSDCMIDTTSQVFLNTAKRESVRTYDPSLPNKATKFNLYVDKVLNKPVLNYEIDIDAKIKIDKEEFKKNKRFEHVKKLNDWKMSRISRLDSLKNADSNFMILLKEALAEIKENKDVSDDAFEEYVGLYVSKESELELKRNRRVYGGCSMDSRPRNHALSIAILSAETAKWDIFLRSHLDIMNDRFERASDGSYAKAQRNTYVKEIEVLDINVLDLILGISLRIENPAKNHYFSSISRVGRALSETSKPKLIEKTILDMITDNDLDDYNRILMYYLFENYNYYLTDENSKKTNQSSLNLAVSKMPNYISSRLISKN